MFITIGIILVVLWLLGFTIHIGGVFINLVLLAALIVLVYGIIARRRV